MVELKLGDRANGQITFARRGNSLEITRGHVGFHSVFLALLLAGGILLIFASGAAIFGLALELLKEFSLLPMLFILVFMLGMAIASGFVFWVQGLLFTRSVVIDLERNLIVIRNGIFLVKKRLPSNEVVISFSVLQSRGDWGYRALLEQRMFGRQLAAVPTSVVGSRKKTIREIGRIADWLNAVQCDAGKIIVHCPHVELA